MCPKFKSNIKWIKYESIFVPTTQINSTEVEIFGYTSVMIIHGALAAADGALLAAEGWRWVGEEG